MDYIASLLPFAISLSITARTARLLVEPTGFVSFFGFFWVPWHDDLPFRVLLDAIVVSIINAILSIIAPRFPRLLAAYKDSGGSPRLPFGFHKLHPDSQIPLVAFLTITISGWLVTAYRLSGPYKFMSSLALMSLNAGIGIYYIIQLARILWIYISHYPEMPPLGLVTGMLWPPAHPVHRFLIRISHRIGRWMEGSASRAVVAGERGNDRIER